MRCAAASSLLALQGALWGCAAPAGEAERPGMLVAPDAQAREELRAAVSRALHGAPVTLADDALTSSTELVIERTPARDATGQRLSGRDLERPQRFRLVVLGQRCVLVQDATGQRFELTKPSCRAVP